MGAHGCNAYCSRSDLLHWMQACMGISDEADFVKIIQDAVAALEGREN